MLRLGLALRVVLVI